MVPYSRRSINAGFYKVDLRMGVDCLIQMIIDTGLTVDTKDKCSTEKFEQRSSNIVLLWPYLYTQSIHKLVLYSFSFLTLMLKYKYF